MQELRWAVNQRKRSGTSSLAMTPPVGQPAHTLLKASKYSRMRYEINKKRLEALSPEPDIDSFREYLEAIRNQIHYFTYFFRSQ